MTSGGSAHRAPEHFSWWFGFTNISTEYVKGSTLKPHPGTIISGQPSLSTQGQTIRSVIPTLAPEKNLQRRSCTVSLLGVGCVRSPSAPPPQLGVHGHQGLAQLGSSELQGVPLKLPHHLNFQGTRSHVNLPKISSSARDYRGIL